MNDDVSMQACEDVGANQYRGFTLIELSIVFAIIALIVGGILTGQDIIVAEQVRATASQIEKYNAAVNAFRSKYNDLPGDLSNPANFFPNVTGAGPGTGRGNGNGLIEGCGGDLQGLDGETAVFWYELYQAGLIADAITNSNLLPQAYTISPNVLPLARIGGGNYIHVMQSNGIHYFGLAGFAGTTVGGTGGFSTINPDLSPNLAFQLDTKVDDGLPESGLVQSEKNTTSGMAGGLGSGTGHPTGSLAAGDCIDTTLLIYATDAAATEDTAACVLRIQANF